MAGRGIRIFTDEMIHADLAPILRSRGYDVESCQEAGRSNQGIEDEGQLQYAPQQGRAILTYNIGHFYELDADWKATGRSHAGIIVSPQIGEFSRLIRLTQQHLDNCDPAAQNGTLLWLGSVAAP